MFLIEQLRVLRSHQNFGKVFVIGLGCECAQISLYKDNNKDNVEYLKHTR